MNSRFFISATIFSLYVALSCLAAPVNAKTYRWVDDQGQVHYGDQIPSNDIDRAYSVMNKEGVRVDNVKKAKTKEQLKEEAQLKKQQEAKDKLAQEQQKYDQILLDTYTKVSDLEETRDRYISTLEGLIKVSQHKLAGLNDKLDKLNKNAANLERDGKTIPEEMHKDIANIQTQIERENNFITGQRSQQKELRDKFAADIKRFKELKAADNEEQGNGTAQPTITR